MDDSFASIASHAELDTLIDELGHLRRALGLPTKNDNSLRIESAQKASKETQEVYGQLNPLEEQYNNLLDRISSLSRAPLSDPLDVLPQEIWENIILNATLTEVWSYPNVFEIVAIDYVLPLTLVSTRWRDAIIDSPRFWTTLQLQSGIDDLEAKFYTSIILSKDLPLLIYIKEDSGPLWERFGHYIVSQNFRIRSIILTNSIDSTSILGTIGEVPMLEALYVDVYLNDYSILLNLIQSARSIRSISYYDLSKEALQCRSMERVRSLSVSGVMKDTLNLLTSMRDLERVSLGITREEDLQMTETRRLAWRDVHLWGPSVDFNMYIFRMVGSTLVKLVVEIPWNKVTDFLLLWCHEMNILQTLSLAIGEFHARELSFSQDEYAAYFQPLNLSPTAVCHFRLTLSRRLAGAPAKAIMTALFANLGSLTPNVRDLSFRSAFGALQAFFTYAFEHKLLQSVVIDDLDTDVQEDWAVLPKNLDESNPEATLKTEYLRITMSVPFHLIKTSGVMTLDAFDPVDYLTDAPQSLMSTEWKNLRTLTISNTANNWANVSLPHVTQITFTGNSYAGSAIGFTSLCQEIATDPRIFPSLEHLESDVKEWDMLFIMLERRNFWIAPFGQDKFSRIKRLELTVLPPAMILKPLTALLGGRFTIRPSNRSLSLAGVAETLFDPEIPGCFRCHTAFHVCSGKKEWRFPVDLSGYEFFFNYPESIGEILATRVERLKQWDSILSRFFMIDWWSAASVGHPSLNTILEGCSDNSLAFKPVEITEYTLNSMTVDETKYRL